ncbi:hypothetical protein CRG98_018865 [Punica granatum]|uniref:Uncharacterized protein n=1 Tax=Punica granatum TaxID=22663 RepID=A0A2I0JWU4_PUNGR|nr:hypothetical protein CRG98_018865 [Punica granatum]
MLSGEQYTRSYPPATRPPAQPYAHAHSRMPARTAACSFTRAPALPPAARQRAPARPVCLSRAPDALQCPLPHVPTSERTSKQPERPSKDSTDSPDSQTLSRLFPRIPRQGTGYLFRRRFICIALLIPTDEFLSS